MFAWGPLLRPGLRWRAGRLLFGVVVITAVTALMLAVPVVSGRGNAAPPVGLDASSSAASRPSDDGSPVVLGEDGGPQRAAGTGSMATPHAPVPAKTSSSASSGTTSPGTSSAPTGTGTASSTAGSDTASTADPSPVGPSPVGPSPVGPSPAPSIAAGSTAPRTSEAEHSPSEQIPPAAPSAPSAPSTADRVLALVNQERARTGCDALSADDALAATAQAHSTAMRDRGSLGHDDADGGSLSDLGGRAVAVARGDSDPAAVVEGWLTDPTDRAALLDCGLRSIGVGTADGDGGPWWTAVLA